MTPHLPPGAIPLVMTPGDDAPYDPTAPTTGNLDGESPTWEGEIYAECTDGTVWEWKSFMGNPSHWAPRPAYPTVVDSVAEAKAKLREAVTNRFRISGRGTCPDPLGPWKDILTFAADQIREVERLSLKFSSLRQTMAVALGHTLGTMPEADVAITALLNERTTVIRGLMSMIDMPTVSPAGRDLSYEARLEDIANAVCFYIMEQRARIRDLERRERATNADSVAAAKDAALWAKAGLTPNPEDNADG